MATLKPPTLAGYSAAALCLLGLVCDASAVGQDRQPQANFSADVNLVLLHVAVIDPRGRDVPALSVEDFTVYDDGVEQDIKLFVSPSDAPLDVALVLDSSASMKPVEMLAQRAALSFLGRLALDDCAFVLPFSDTAGPGKWGRAADPSLRSFIGGIRSQGGTALYDAILEGLAQLERANANELVAVANEAEEGPDPGEEEQEATPPQAAGPERFRDPNSGETITLPPRRPSLLSQVGDAVRELDLSAPPPVTGCGEPLPAGEQTNAANARRKALVLVSDGADMDSDAEFYDALGAARAASVPAFPVALGYAKDDPNLQDRLEEIARATGGRMVQNSTPGELGASYDQVVTLLRSYYLIGYDPARGDDGVVVTSGARPRWHDVEVSLRRPYFEPLVRPGYYR